MRPAAVERLGYYPTPETLFSSINSYLIPAKTTTRLYDPCCGKGIAAQVVGKHVNATTLGVEMSYSRAEEAEKVLDQVHCSPMQEISLTEESVSVLFLNPPYEFDHDLHKRYEQIFLSKCSKNLCRGGMLIYIIPQHQLMTPAIADLLWIKFENLQYFRFPDPEFSAFKQIIVLGTKRKSFEILNKEESKKISALGNPNYELPVFEAVGEPQYQILGTPPGGMIFRRSNFEDSEKIVMASKYGIHHSNAWKDLMFPNGGKVKLTHPVMPLKKGHIATTISSGMMDVVRLIDSDDNKPMLLKGRVIKTQEKTGTQSKTDENGKETKTETWKDKFSTTVTVTKGNKVEVIKDTKELGVFIEKYVDQLANFILNTFTPLYNFDPSPEETAMLDTFGTKRKILPGQTKAGLLPNQKHLTAALARCLKKNHVANVQGEMGIGKSTIAAAAAAMLGPKKGFPLIVLCPPHLVAKWIREIEETIPGSKARELKMIGMNSSTSMCNDVEVFLADVRAGKMGEYPVAVMSHSSSKFASGFSPVMISRKMRNRRLGKMVDVMCCPKCGNPVTIEGPKGMGDYIPENMEQVPVKKKLYCTSKVKGHLRDSEKKLMYDDNGNQVWGMIECGAPLWSVSTKTSARRTALAEYILKKLPHGTFKTLIADECHEFKTEDSDRGIAFHQLVMSTINTIALTGTFFGGMSSSIFWLLHRLNHGVRKEFDFTEATRWAARYGVLETQREAKSDDEYGYTGNRRKRSEPKEKPGISPEVIARLLDTFLFMSVKDLGVAMPGYSEEVVTIPMEKEQSDQYKEMYKILYDRAKGNPRFLSTWLQSSLSRPNSGFRKDEIFVTVQQDAAERFLKGARKSGNKDVALKEKIMELEPIISGVPTMIDDELINVLPKEKWLASFVADELAQGRKCLIYVRQTGDKDIQGRIKEVLSKTGVKATILRSSVETGKREEWIDSHVNNMDAMICNPNLVKTGFDLVMFSTVIFYEIEYSLYTLWQAVRRVWRLGQDKDVKAVFSVYAGTVEEAALTLMGKKMKAAQLLYGDEVGGAIVEEDDDDLQTQLAKLVRASEGIQDLQSLFSKDTKITAADIKTTPKIVRTTVVQKEPTQAEVSWLEWMKQSGVKSASPAKKKSGNKGVYQGQQALF